MPVKTSKRRWGKKKGDFVRQDTDFAIQSTRGFSFSRKGIPRITDWMPMLATKKVCCIDDRIRKRDNTRTRQNGRSVRQRHLGDLTGGHRKGKEGTNLLVDEIDGPETTRACRMRDERDEAEGIEAGT